MNYAISGTATSGADFTALPGTRRLCRRATRARSINITALADTEIEDAETVTLTLLPGTRLHAHAEPGRQRDRLHPRWRSADGGCLGGRHRHARSPRTARRRSAGTALRFIVSRKVATATDLVVNYTMSGTATEGVDYTGTTGSVTILANATSAYVNITPVNDTDPEGVGEHRHERHARARHLRRAHRQRDDAAGGQ